MNLANEQADALDCAISRVEWSRRTMDETRRRLERAKEDLKSAECAVSRETHFLEQAEEDYLRAKEHLRATVSTSVTIAVR